MKPAIRIRFDANGVRWFNPVGRQWLPVDETAKENIVRIFHETFGFRN